MWSLQLCCSLDTFHNYTPWSTTRQQVPSTRTVRDGCEYGGALRHDHASDDCVCEERERHDNEMRDCPVTGTDDLQESLRSRSLDPDLTADDGEEKQLYRCSRGVPEVTGHSVLKHTAERYYFPG